MNHAFITWAVIIGAPVAGILIGVIAFRGPAGEQRNRMWTQGPFVPIEDEEKK
jgi:uncharacterized membrane-anchored protein YhcB (DUF1043 family)